MNKAKQFLAEAAGRLQLPVDVLAGVPKMELLGFREFSVEPHHGLVEYERQKISIDSSLGTIVVLGQDLTIKLMNRQRITIKGSLSSVELWEVSRV